MASKARKGTTKRNREKSATLPKALKPFVQKKADSKKKNPNEKTVGEVSKKTA